MIDARNTSGNFFANIREQMNGISSNTGIELIQSFEPQAMYDLMSGMGYEHRTEKRKKGEYHIYFFKKEQHKD